jgi:D-proline reductase (dithiol) PrdB
MDMVLLQLANLEEQWEAYNARSLVSHHPHFVPARNTTVAFTRPSKPLKALRVALLSSGGVHLKASPAFDMQSHAGDDTIRWIPGDTATANLRFAHDHYDHTDADHDPNCMFPLDRLRDLAADGTIGGVARWHVGLMGFIPNPTRFVSETVPAIISRLHEDAVDAVVLSPG